MTTLLVAANVGVMLFFTIVVAPVVFKVLPRDWAGVYVRAFFPRYFAFLGVTSLLAALSAAQASLQVALSLCAALFFFSLWVLTPRINQARDAGKTRTFGALHGLSVVLNLAQLAFFVGVLWVGSGQTPS
jgi:hypothetical protein